MRPAPVRPVGPVGPVGLVGLAALVMAAVTTACSASAPTDRAPAPTGAGSARHGRGHGAVTRTPRPSTTSPPPAGHGSPASGATGWGPTRAEARRARAQVHRLSLPALAGQVIVARYRGTGAPDDLVTDLHLGGVIVLGDNITGVDQIRRSNERLQRAARAAGRGWPVFVGVDQEGGVVQRVKGEATRFPTFMSQGAARRPDLTARVAKASGAELAHLGFSVVYAPDADVTTGPHDPTIGSRSAGSHPARVARQVDAALQGYLASGVIPVVKHFPGHGSVPADSHRQLPVQRRSLRALRRNDLVPFSSAIEDGAPAVMVAHIDVRAVDPGVPATLSRPVTTGLLRDRLGFDGLVTTDALDMAAVTRGRTSAQAAVGALRAGADVLLMPPDPEVTRAAVVRAVRAGRLSRDRLEQAAARQVALLEHRRRTAPGATDTSVAPGSHRRLSRRLSAAAVTVVSGPCSGRLVGRAVRASGSTDDVAAFDDAATRAGLRTGAGTSVALVGYHGAARTADVVVSLDTPYVLGESTAGVAKVALYGSTPEAMRALVDVLLGRSQAPGRLPVPVGHVQRAGC